MASPKPFCSFIRFIPSKYSFKYVVFSIYGDKSAKIPSSAQAAMFLFEVIIISPTLPAANRDSNKRFPPPETFGAIIFSFKLNLS